MHNLEFYKIIDKGGGGGGKGWGCKKEQTGS